MIQQALVIVGALLQVCQVIPFLVETIRGKAKPNVVSWFTWTLLTVVGSAGAFADHGWQAGVIVGANGVGTAAVVVLGFWRGYATLTRFDAICQLIALAGLATWPFVHGPVLAVLVAVAIDAVAAAATLYHAYRKPNEEAWATYALACLGSICGLLTLTEFTIASSLYLMYLVVADLTLSTTILIRKRVTT